MQEEVRYVWVKMIFSGNETYFNDTNYQTKTNLETSSRRVEIVINNFQSKGLMKRFGTYDSD